MGPSSYSSSDQRQSRCEISQSQPRAMVKNRAMTSEFNDPARRVATRDVGWESWPVNMGAMFSIERMPSGLVSDRVKSKLYTLQGCCLHVICNTWFDAFIGIVIFINSLSVGVDQEFRTMGKERD